MTHHSTDPTPVDPFDAQPGDTVLANGGNTPYVVIDTVRCRDGATRILGKRLGPLGPVTRHLYFYPAPGATR
jgi:hypothetical protein